MHLAENNFRNHTLKRNCHLENCMHITHKGGMFSPQQERPPEERTPCVVLEKLLFYGKDISTDTFL